MNSRILKVLEPSHGPCRHFQKNCKNIKFLPSHGHVPRGVCGANGDLSEVKLVMVFSEPGDPLDGQNHEKIGFSYTSQYSDNCLRNPPTPFHRNVRLIMDLCFPKDTFDQQLKKVLRTNSVLCSAEVESGYIGKSISRTCISEYLKPQLALIPNAVVSALGNKAQCRLEQAGIDAFPVLHPSCRKSNAEKMASWTKLANHIRSIC